MKATGAGHLRARSLVHPPRRRACRFIFVAIVALLAGAVASPAELEPVFCPAIQVQDRPRTNYPGESRIPPVLVALGTATVVSKSRGGDARLRLEIEEVLYGDRQAKVVEFAWPWEWEGRAIYFLAPAGMEGRPAYDYRSSMEADQLPAARALCVARLASLALNAESVIVGQEMRAGEYIREVKVVENIAGKRLPGNKILRLAAPFQIIQGEDIIKYPGKRLYFLRSNKNRPDEPMTYGMLSTLPVDSRAEVLAALRKRGAYPLIGAPPDTGIAHYREVILDGDAVEAMALIDSPDEAAQLLGQRYFFHHADEGRARLTPLIEDFMLRTGLATADEFSLQKRRIASLAMVEGKSPTDALGTLAEKLIAALEAAPASIPMPVRDDKVITSQTRDGTTYRIAEETTVDTNHSLTWLLQQLGEDDVARRWDQRLVALKQRLDGWWQHEAALAVDVLRVESNRELNAAVTRTKDLKPVRSSITLRHPNGGRIKAVAFSPNGLYLATSDDSREVRILSTADWRCLGVLPRPATRIAFSPDSMFLYLNGGSERDAIFSRWEWQTARRDQSYRNPSMWINRMQLSRDGRTMLTASYMDGSLIIWNTETGRPRRTALLPSINSAAALSGDGKLLARFTSESKPADPRKFDHIPGIISSRFASPQKPQTGFVVETVDGKKTILRAKSDIAISHFAFTQDGAYLISVGDAEYGKMRLQIRKVEARATLVAEVRTEAHFVNDLVVSPDGKYVAVRDEEQRFWLYSVPALELVWSTRLNTIEGVSFSPDGKRLILADGQPTPRIISMDGFEEVAQYEGHAGQISGAFFSADSRRMWSFGKDGSLCHWDAATMKMIDLRPPPKGCRLQSIAAPDGKYALYFEQDPVRSTVPKAPAFGNGSPATPSPEPAPAGDGHPWAYFVDAESGEVVSRMEIPVGSSDHGFHWLSGGQFIAVGEAGTTLVADYLNGKVLRQIAYQPENFGGAYYLSEDRKSMLGNVPYAQPRLPKDRIDLETGAVTQPEVKGEGEVLTAGGETYTLLSRAPKPKKLPEIRGVEILSSVLSPDRRRLAVVTGERIYVDANLRQWDSKTPTVIRIYDAESLRLICAIPSATRWIGASFNADGTHLAIAHEDGTIERWPLPE